MYTISRVTSGRQADGAKTRRAVATTAVRLRSSAAAAVDAALCVLMVARIKWILYLPVCFQPIDRFQ